MYCKKCGAALDNSAQFCTNCGTKQPAGLPANRPTYPQRQPVQTQPTATAALVLGIIGLLAWFVPIIGYPITIVGLVLGVKGYNRKLLYGKAAMTLNIIGLSLCFINSILGAIRGAMGVLF